MRTGLAAVLLALAAGSCMQPPAEATRPADVLALHPLDDAQGLTGTGTVAPSGQRAEGSGAVRWSVAPGRGTG